MRTARHWSSPLLTIAAISGTFLAAAAGASEEPPPAPALYDNLGSYHRAITTYRPDAQAYFDQGMRWMHAFNLEEAETAFAEAARRDPSCAMCSWGVAFALGPHINLPAMPERTVAAAAAIAEAKRRAEASASAASDVERALIDAMAKRYSDPAPETPEGQAALNQAYADALRGVARRFPDDAEVAFLFAEGLMNLHPWDLWESDGRPKPWTPEIVAAIERGLALDDGHPGLHHLHIHSVEASPPSEAARAITSADFLREAMPGAGHMVHMPGHIYLRVGRYGDAATVNERAIAVDGVYLPKASPNTAFYRMMYAPHNVDFLAAAAAFEGRSAAALMAQRSTVEGFTAEMLAHMPGFDFITIKPLWTLVQFGRYEEALAEPAPPAGFPYSAAMFEAARGLAFAGLGRVDEARAALDAADSEIAKIAPEATQAQNSAQTLASIGRNLLAGSIAVRSGEIERGIAMLEEAAKGEDGLRYDEPNDWYFPVRHVSGPILLGLGRNQDAERVFRADLAKFPENGWSLAGLSAALARQGKAEEARLVEERRKKAWTRADLGLEKLMAPPGPATSPAG